MHVRYGRHGRQPQQCPKLAAIAAIAGTMALSLVNVPAYPMTGTGASSRSSSLDFAISIPRAAELRSMCTPHAINITAADVERGFVDVPRAWCVEIRANIPYEVSFTSRASWFRSALLRGLPAAVEVRDGTGQYDETRATGAPDEMNLGVTFYLVPGTHPGHYAWPISIALAGK